MPDTLPEPILTDGTDLVLRRHQERDLDGIVAQCRDPESVRWTTVPTPYGPEEAGRFLKQVRERWDDGTTAALAIEHRERFCGSLDLRLDGSAGAEVGYGLAPWARGQGVMRRALVLALGWGFDTLGLSVVHWRAEVGNERSRRTAEACGFRVEGTVRELLVQRGERRDGWIGSLLPGDMRVERM